LLLLVISLSPTIKSITSSILIKGKKKIPLHALVSRLSACPTKPWRSGVYILPSWLILTLILNPSPIHQLFYLTKATLYLNFAYQLYKIPLKKQIIQQIILFQIIALSTLAILQLLNQGSIGGPLYLLGERSHTLLTPGIAKQTLRSIEVIRPYATFSHPNTLSGWIFISLLCTLSQFHAKKVNQKLIILLITIISTITLLITNSQAVYLTAALIALYHITTHRHRPKRPLSLITSALIALLTPAFLLLLNNTNEESILLRNTIFLNHLKALAQHPLIGMGWHGFLLQLKNIPALLNTKTIQPVHNAIWFLIGTLGIPLSALLAIKLIPKLKSIKITPRTYPLAAILLLSGFDHYFLTQPQTLLLAILITALYFNLNYEMHTQ
jgi:hypothetical protein